MYVQLYCDGTGAESWTDTLAWLGSLAAATRHSAAQDKGRLRRLPRPHGRNYAQMAGFSLHADTFVGPAARDELYKVGKHLYRPSIAGKRITVQKNCRSRVELKTAWRDRMERTSEPHLSPGYGSTIISARRCRYVGPAEILPM